MADAPPRRIVPRRTGTPPRHTGGRSHTPPRRSTSSMPQASHGSGGSGSGASGSYSFTPSGSDSGSGHPMSASDAREGGRTEVPRGRDVTGRGVVQSPTIPIPQRNQRWTTAEHSDDERDGRFNARAASRSDGRVDGRGGPARGDTRGLATSFGHAGAGTAAAMPSVGAQSFGGMPSTSPFGTSWGAGGAAGLVNIHGLHPDLTPNRINSAMPLGSALPMGTGFMSAVPPITGTSPSGFPQPGLITAPLIPFGNPSYSSMPPIGSFPSRPPSADSSRDERLSVTSPTAAGNESLELALARQKARYEERLGHLERELAMSKRAFEDQRAGFDARIRDMEQHGVVPVHITQQIARLQQEYAQLRDHCGRLERERDSVVQNQQRAAEALAAGLNAKFEDEKKVLRREIATLRSRRELASPKHLTEALERAQRDMENEKLILAQMRTKLAAENDVTLDAVTLAVRVEELLMENATLHSKTERSRVASDDPASVQIAKLQAENAQLKDRYTELKRVQEYFQSGGMSAEQELAGKLNDAQLALDRLERENVDLKAKVGIFVSAGGSLDAVKLQATVNEMNEMVTALKIRYDREVEANRSLRKTDNTGTRAELDEMRVTLGYHRDELERIRNENADLHERLKEAQLVRPASDLSQLLDQRRLQEINAATPFIPRPVEPSVRRQRRATFGGRSAGSTDTMSHGGSNSRSPNTLDDLGNGSDVEGSDEEARITTEPQAASTSVTAAPARERRGSMDDVERPAKDQASSKRRYAEWLDSARANFQARAGSQQ